MILRRCDGRRRSDRSRGDARGARTRERRASSWTTAPPASSARCATSAAHVLAEAVMDLFPGTKLGIGPVITDGFYYDFLLPRPLTPDDLAGHRGADARVASPPTTRSSSARGDARAGARRAHRTRPAVQGRDRRRPGRRGRSATARRCRRRPSTSRGRSSTCAAARTSRARAGSARSSCSAVAGAYWRGDREAPDAPARLRHGVGDAGGARPVPVAARGGEEARPPPARGPARPVQLPRRLAGRGVLAPEGLDALPDARERHARAPGAARLPGDLHATGRQPAAVGAVGALGPLSGAHVPRRVRGPDVQPQADELPRVDLHLPQPGALVPRPAAAATRSTGSSIGTSSPARSPG